MQQVSQRRATAGMRSQRSVLITAATTFALASAACGGPSRLQTYTVGPAGHQILIAAAPNQKVPIPTMSGPTPNSVVAGATYYSYSLRLPGSGRVDVTVSVSRRAIPAAHARWIIQDFFNNVPERLTTWHGRPADAGVQPCSTPAGPCPGWVGGIQVLRDGTLYDVVVSADSKLTASAVVNSFDIFAKE